MKRAVRKPGDANIQRQTSNAEICLAGEVALDARPLTLTLTLSAAYGGEGTYRPASPAARGLCRTTSPLWTNSTSAAMCSA